MRTSLQSTSNASSMIIGRLVFTPWPISGFLPIVGIGPLAGREETPSARTMRCYSVRPELLRLWGDGFAIAGEPYAGPPKAETREEHDGHRSGFHNPPLYP